MDHGKDEANLRRLAQKHREYHERLVVLAGRRFPTALERLEEATLKKRKLKVKDEIESILSRRPELAGHEG